MNEKQDRLVRIGLGVGLLLAVAIMVPALGRGSEDEAQEDTGRALAEAGGCDLSRSEVPVSESVFDYYVDPETARPPVGAASSVEEAVLSISDDLAGDGAVFSREELEAATAATDSDPIEVRLEGVVIFVERWDADTYLVRGLAMCA